MPVVPIAAAVGAAAAVVGTVSTISAQNKANALGQKQYAYQKQLNDLAVTRQRRDAIRAARLSAGTVTSAANNQGASMTSAAEGGLGSIQSQLNDNLSFLDTSKTLTNDASEAGLERQSALTNAGNWAAISSLGMQVFSLSQGGKGRKR